MQQNKTALERAFELARSVEIANVAEVKRALRKEGYEEGHLDGPSIARQLKEIIRLRQKSKASKPGD